MASKMRQSTREETVIHKLFPESQRQLVVAHVQPDLCWPELKLAVEIDGQHHRYGRHPNWDKLKESIAAARKGLELNPLYVDIHNDLGTALLKLGKRDEGKRELLLAFNDATNPYPEVSSRNLGQASFEERNYPEAINWFRTSISRNKSYPDAYLGLADSLLATGRPDEALLSLEAGVKELPAHPALLVALGEAYQRAGRLNDARTKLEEASRHDPGGPAGKRALELLKGLPSR